MPARRRVSSLLNRWSQHYSPRSAGAHPIDARKIDRTLILQMERDHRQAAAVQTIQSFICAASIRLAAGGIESLDQVV